MENPWSSIARPAEILRKWTRLTESRLGRYGPRPTPPSASQPRTPPATPPAKPDSDRPDTQFKPVGGSPVSVEEAWTCIKACRILAVWPEATDAQVGTARDQRIMEHDRQKPIWNVGDDYRIGLIRAAAAYLLGMSADERGARLAAELQEAYATALAHALLAPAKSPPAGTGTAPPR
ncbi:hypothetical protein [Thiomonas sp.]